MTGDLWTLILIGNVFIGSSTITLPGYHGLKECDAAGQFYARRTGWQPKQYGDAYLCVPGPGWHPAWALRQ